MQTVALLLAYVIPVLALIIIYPPARPVVFIWLVSLGGYLLLFLLSPELRHSSYRTVFQSMLALFALIGLELLLRRVGYGRGGRDPAAVWVLYLIPLLLIGRRGRTLYWTVLVSITIAAFFGFFAWAIAEPSVPPASAWRVAAVFSTRLAFVLCVAAFCHAIVREMHHYKNRLTIEREMVDLLTSQRNFTAAYQAAAEAILRLHPTVTQYAFVLLLDEPWQRLKVVGVAGHPLDRWQDLELATGQGITGEAVRTGQTQRVPDVRMSPWDRLFFGPGALAHVRSEMAAPILVDGRVIGVLDVESLQVNAYSRYHQAKLEAWAQALALSYKHFEAVNRRIAASQDLFETIVDLGEKYSTERTPGGHVLYRSWFRAVAKQLCAHFDADYAAFLRLGAGTAYPLVPPVIWPSAELGALRESFRHHTTVQPNSVISRLIDDWQIRDWCTREEWAQWRNDDDRWLLEAFGYVSVSTLIFIPIGPRHNRLAMLFLGFRRPELLTEMGRLTLDGLSTALATSFNSLFPWSSDLHHAGIRIHQNVITRTQGAFARVDSIRHTVGRLPLDSSTAAHLTHTLDDIGSDIRKFRQIIKHATLHERFDLSEISLDIALRNTADEFREIEPERLKIPVHVDDGVEDQELFVRQLLYWVAVESIANALEHGHAATVSVSLRAANAAIRLTVVDDGIGLPPNPNRHQPHGIYYLARLVRRLNGGLLSVGPHDTPGAKVELRLPIRSR